jgi:hypothetical protein
MILVEIAHLVHEIDGRSHILGQLDIHSTNITGVACILVEGRIIQEGLLFHPIHDNEKGYGKCDEYEGHDEIEDDGFFEGCLSQLTVYKK